MTDPTRPVSGYPAQPTNGYQPPQQQQHPPPQPNYYYPNSNPNQHQHHYPPPPPQPPSARAVLYRRFMSALIFFFIAFFIAFFIVYLVRRPRVPVITITALSLSSLNLSSTSLSATWSATFAVSNPNTKNHVYYDEIEARLFYHSSILALNQLPPFDQATKDQTDVNARLVASSAYIEPGLARDFTSDRSRGTVKFDVQVLALVRFKAGGWRARWRGLRAFCDGLPVAINGSTGGLIGGPRRCAVGI